MKKLGIFFLVHLTEADAISLPSLSGSDLFHSKQHDKFFVES